MSVLKKYQKETGPGFISNDPGFLKKARAVYDFSVDGGAATLITPATNEIIPANAVMLGGVVNVLVAVTASGAASVSVGISAGGAGAAQLLASTAKGSLTLNALLATVPTFAAPVKTTAESKITVTPTAILLTGKLEIVQYYYLASA